MRYLFLLLCSYTFNANTQNLLSNGDFDSDVNGWSNPFITFSWDGGEGGPISGNGSMKADGGAMNNNASFPVIADKVAVKPGYVYLSSMAFKIAGDSAAPRAWFVIRWYDTEDNFIESSPNASSAFGPDTDVWHNIEGVFTAPDMAASGELRIYFQRGGVGDDRIAYGWWDDVYLLEETIFVGAFE